MGQGKKTASIFAVLILLLFTTACGSIYDPFDLNPFDGNNNHPSANEPTVEATDVYIVPLGGFDAGRDELVIYDEDGNIADLTGKSLELLPDNSNVELLPRDGFADIASGSGAKILPKFVGTTIITVRVDGIETGQAYKVIVPPQSLIQILMGEARGQIYAEAQVSDGHVSLDSESPTANAVASVIRNRVLLIESGQPYSLFVVNEESWLSDEPSSHWDAVITAENGTFHQFSPLDETSVSYDIYYASENRENLSDESEIVAYDQAVLTAGYIFDNQIEDPAGGAFAFRSPTLDESDCLTETLEKGYGILPNDCGPGDENYPAFAPVQILIHPSVAFLDDGRPSFIFYRNRTEDEPAVTNAP